MALTGVGFAVRQAGQPGKVHTLSAGNSGYDIYAPKSCVKMLMEDLHTTDTQVIPVKQFLLVRDKLTACGGYIKQVK